ncbi:MAG: sigma-70 family RNA polymerase sigma factor [Bryobacterales bacterium]|nr:sigma-70 family RNA polymerase sigma factor [Bryobacterales bacterium]MBV9400114.1 sigma-70 family RNA polymerase sigma factor [Bryobacterales bacterium]
MRSEDRDLVEQLLAGDPTAWHEWNARFRPVLAAIARREFRLPPEDIEDLLQDLALALLNDSGRQLRAYRQEASLCSWLCAIWRHRCLDLKRRRSGCRLPAFVPLLSPSIEASLLASETLGLASKRDRFLLQMHFIDGWSERDLAASLQIPENTIASSLARARTRLKKIVGAPARKPPAHTPTH